MSDGKDIFQPSIWQNIGKINFQNLTDEQLEAMIDEANQKNNWLSLPIPATQENINLFFDKVFKCKRCGKCCQGELQSAREDYIPLLDEEIIQIANFLRIRPRRIKRLCKTNSMGMLSLPYPCPFYKDTPKPNCSVYSVRPLSCRYYPLYGVTSSQGLNEKPDGKPLLTIDAECPQAKEITLQIFKWMRNSAQSEHHNSHSRS